MPVRIAKPAVNIREKLAELERPIGLNGSALMRTETPQDAFSLIGAGRRNLIINGDMRISQRGTSFTNLATNQYTLDRFFMGSSTNAFTVSQGTSILPSGKSVNTFDLVCNSNATHWLDPYQGIEDFRSISGQTVTLSAWVKTNHPNVNFRQYATRNIGNTFIPDGQWRYYTATTTLGTISSLTRGVNSPYFGIANSSSSSWTSGQYIQFTEFQIELGKIATPFEYRLLGEELRLCQRYYYDSDPSASTSFGYNGNPIATAPTIAVGSGIFPVSMRAVPTVTLPGGADQSGVGNPAVSSSQISVNGFVRINSASNFSLNGTPLSARFIANIEL